EPPPASATRGWAALRSNRSADFALRHAMCAAHVRSGAADHASRVDALRAQALEGLAHSCWLEPQGLADDDEAEGRARTAAAHPVLRLGLYFLYRAQVTTDAVLEHCEQQRLDAADRIAAWLAPAQYPL